MWQPDLRLSRSWSFSGLIVLLHGLVILSLLQLPASALILLPLVLVSMLMAVAKYGLFLLNRSVQRVWLAPEGWYLSLKNGVQLGPYMLHDATRLDDWFVRLSLCRSTWERRHLILNSEMIGEDQFRRLKVFLRWADHRGQPNEENAGLNKWPAQLKQWLAKRLPALVNWIER